MKPFIIIGSGAGDRNWPIRIFVFTMLVLLLPACALVAPQTVATEHVPSVDQPLTAPADPQLSYWWYVKVKMAWPEEQEPAWYMDSLLARQVFRSQLLAHALDIEMWRFHRRAVRDNSGHQFSFIFYAKKPAAQAILNGVAQNPTMRSLMDAGNVESLQLFDANKNPSSAIEATSDPNWTPEMQRAWPYYAMGVSQLWLSLIDQYVASALHNGENLPNEKNVNELVEYYKHINDNLNATWENEGGHALFGYRELFVFERRQTRF
jgi:hypothetical protein